MQHNNVLATITVATTDTEIFLSVLEKMHKNISCECISIDSIRGTDTSKYTLDITDDCLVYIQNHVKLVGLTVTRYDTSDGLGLKSIKQHYQV